MFFINHTNYRALQPGASQIISKQPCHTFSPMSAHYSLNAIHSFATDNKTHVIGTGWLAGESPLRTIATYVN